MGNRHPAAAYFTRGTGHNEEARYSEDSQVWEALLNRLKKKYYTARTLVPKPSIDSAGSRIGFIAFGSTDPAIHEARTLLKEQGINTDYMQIKAVPFTTEVKEFIAAHEVNYVVELNRDGQMHGLLLLDNPEFAGRLVSLAHLDGLPLTAKWVMDAFLSKEATK
jgi:2-oxoglutarate ferredoxin oxidoreductase subunit alpha